MSENDPGAAVPAVTIPLAAVASVVSTESGKLVVHTSAAKGVLVALLTGGLRIVGAALVAHGLATDGMVNAFIPAAAQDIAGAVLVTAGQAWALYREEHAHNKIVAAANTAAADIVFK